MRLPHGANAPIYLLAETATDGKPICRGAHAKATTLALCTTISVFYRPKGPIGLQKLHYKRGAKNLTT
jgi:P pilus assembly chaperone PapD